MEKENRNLGGVVLESKKKKRKVGVLVFSTVLGLVLLLGLSYAFFTLTKTGEKTNVIKVGKLSLKLSEEGTAINIENAIPTLIENGLTGTPYTFSITNDGTVPSYFQLIFHDDNQPASGYRRTISNYLYYSLTKNGYLMSTDKLSNLKDSSKYNSILDLGVLDPGVENQYELRLWLDYNYTTMSTVDPSAVTYTISVSSDQLRTELLSTKIMRMAEGTGEVDGMHYFANVDNAYIWYSGKLWNAIGYTDDGAVKAVTSSPQTMIPWGSNVSYKDSYVRTWVNDSSSTGFLGHLHDYEKFLVTDYAWNYSSLNSDGYTLANDSYVQEPVGLLNYVDIRGGSSETLTSNANFTSDNKIAIIHGTYYIATSSGSSIMYTGNDYLALSNGKLSPQDALTNVSPAVVFRKGVKVIAGNGTAYDPWILEGDLTAKSNDSLNTRNSGEYVSFGGGEMTKYRIDSVSSGMTKLVASVSPISRLVVDNTEHYRYINTNFHRYVYNTSTPTTSERFMLDTFLQQYYLNPTNNFMTTSDLAKIETNTTWYLGTIDYGGDYHLAKDPTTAFQATVAYPGVGDLQMFSSYADMRLTLLNSYEQYHLLLTKIKKWNGQFAFTITSLNTFSDNGQTSARPSFYLKSNVKIKSGTGTFYDPYILQ